MKKLKQAIVFLFPIAILASLAACGATGLADSADGRGLTAITGDRDSTATTDEGTGEANEMALADRYKVDPMTNAMHQVDGMDELDRTSVDAMEEAVRNRVEGMVEAERTNIGDENSPVQTHESNQGLELNLDYQHYAQRANGDLNKINSNYDIAQTAFGKKPVLKDCAIDDCN